MDQHVQMVRGVRRIWSALSEEVIDWELSCDEHFEATNRRPSKELGSGVWGRHLQVGGRRRAVAARDG